MKFIKKRKVKGVNMKNIKKIFCLMLSLVIAACSVVPMAFAESEISSGEESTHSTGLIWDTWDSYLNKMNETTLRALAVQRTGDLDADGKVTALDARLCLLASAQLSKLTYQQSVAADVDGNFGISSLDARKILRTSAKLETLFFTMETTPDWGVVVGPLKGSENGKYSWVSNTDTQGLLSLDIIQKTVAAPEGSKDTSPEYFFVITPKHMGQPEVRFSLMNSDHTETLEQFSLVLTISGDVTISKGGKYSVEGLLNGGNGRYNWQCSVDPDTGITVEENDEIPFPDRETGPVEQIFTFTGVKEGTYSVTFVLKSSWEDPIKKFTFKITVE